MFFLHDRSNGDFSDLFFKPISCPKNTKTDWGNAGKRNKTTKIV
jgi:hypothetical protein